MKHQMIMRIVVLILCLTITLISAFAQEDEARTFKIAKIEFVGLKIYDDKQALLASGLQIGQETNLSGIKAALSRLLKSGMFRRGKFHYLFVENQAELVFELVEVRSLPCIFDNFVWFQEAEINSAIRQSFPTFDGAIPETDLVIVRIKGILQKLLQEKNIPGQVEYIFSDGGNEQSKHIFRVSSPAPLVCSLRFDGIKMAKENDFAKASKSLLNAEYSIFATHQFAALNLLSLYRRQGFLRASFQAVSAQLENTNKCKNGAAVTIFVNEGIAYKWNQPTWSGNQAFTNAVLESSLGFKVGDPANGEKIDQGINAVLKTYLKAGYVGAQILPKPVFDESTGQISYEITVVENGQFRMGEIGAPNLVATNIFAEGDMKKLLSGWKLKPGDIFDAVYFSEFLDKKTEELKLLQQGKRVQGKLKPNPQTLTLDVELFIGS
jgi:outer membrane protein assembly factor BamA